MLLSMSAFPFLSRIYPQVILLASLMTLLGLPLDCLASSTGDDAVAHDFTATWFGVLAVMIFVIAYCFVIAEEPS